MINNTLKFLLSIFLISFQINFTQAQKSINDSAITLSFVGINYQYMIPGGDMAKRFGNNSTVGLNYCVKLKSNWSISADGQFLFGNKIKEGYILGDISTEDNKIISTNGDYADVRLYERGYYITLNLGRIFTLKKPNPNSGFWVTVGAGFMQHKIRIETIGNNVPELSKDYKKGYDRLSNGLLLREFLGYVYFGKRKLINLYAGIEFTQGFTKSRRDYNFDTRIHDNKNRLDLLYGIRVGWLLPLYKKPPDKFYIN